MKSIWKLAAVVAVATLASCGGGGGDDAPTTLVAASDTSLSVNPTTGAALVTAVTGQAFTFTGGAAPLGTTAATTVTLNGGAAPTFAIAEGNNSATGNLQFGSCIFVVTTSSFPASHALATGKTVTVNPCNLNVATAGAVANGVATSRSVALVLGAASSVGASVTVGVNPGGALTLNGNIVTTVTLKPVTG
ncbi:hypothetical protein [Ramlibacter algicola]|uniref:Lipoprotein n=1 Tax=Ramlibacter algicola TaxID=2795217 RepID=A0A934Q0D3_9BURK|nr:hypothetical protein [Ramlibacter algicola]MBK0391977.1 hypothetical protein [Ramlibacter algicola]